MQDDDIKNINDSERENAFVRYVRGALIILSMCINGLIIGAWFSAHFIVKQNSGFAGGAEVAVGGLVAGIVFIVISTMMLQRLKNHLLFQIMIVSVLTTLVLIGVMVSLS